MNYNGLTFKKLEVFLTYMETQSMAKAAERLNMTGVGVHRALHSLEDWLHCKLFIAEGRTLRPIQSAYTFKRYAAHMLEYLEKAANHCREVAEGERTTLRIGTLYSLTPKFMPTVISKIALEYPQIRIELTADSNQRLLEKLKANLLDSIIISTPADYDTQNFHSTFLFEDEVFIVTSPSSSFKPNQPVDLKELKAKKFVTLSDGFATFQGLQQAAARADFTPNLALQVHDIFTVGGLVRAGVGYSLLPGRARDIFPDLTFSPLQSQYCIKQQVSLITLNQSMETPEFQTLRNVCVECARPYFSESSSVKLGTLMAEPKPTSLVDAPTAPLYKINAQAIIQNLERRGYFAVPQDDTFAPPTAIEYAQLHKNQKKLKLEIHPELASTAKEMILRHGAGAQVQGCIITALAQTAGYGRMTRPWVGQAGGSLMFSLGWRFARPVIDISSLSLVCGVAIANALERQGLQGIELKWPNDLIYKNSKLGGILIEVLDAAEHETTVAVGVGLNLAYESKRLADISQAATDLKTIAADLGLSTQLDANAIYAAVLDELTTSFCLYNDHGFRGFQPRWEALHSHQGQRVRIVQGDSSMEGTVLGITPSGAIRIHDGHKEYQHIVGDVSLRPL